MDELAKELEELLKKYNLTDFAITANGLHGELLFSKYTLETDSRRSKSQLAIELEILKNFIINDLVNPDKEEVPDTQPTDQ